MFTFSLGHPADPTEAAGAAGAAVAGGGNGIGDIGGLGGEVVTGGFLAGSPAEAVCLFGLGAWPVGLVVAVGQTEASWRCGTGDGPTIGDQTEADEEAAVSVGLAFFVAGGPDGVAAAAMAASVAASSVANCASMADTEGSLKQIACWGKRVGGNSARAAALLASAAMSSAANCSSKADTEGTMMKQVALLGQEDQAR
jgi:hypothetical protein